MTAKNKTEKKSAAGVTIQLHLLGIIVFSASLILAASLMTFAFARVHETGGGSGAAKLYFTTNAFGTLETEATNVPPWGQLSLRDIDLELPEEYVAYQIGTNRVETWTFENMNPDAVRSVLQSSGLTAQQIEQALSAACVDATNATTVVTPDSGLVLSLSPGVRAKLYTVLGRSARNELMKFPFCFPGNSFAERVDQTKISPEVRAMIEKMLYPSGEAQCFSDLEVLLRQIPDESERLKTVMALSHQSAVLMGIRVWPDSDLDKIMGYWSLPAGVHLMNARPLLESIKREPGGGYASVLFFLPPFARARLYTFPLPSQAGEPAMDCHWTTMNFFNETPDNRFSDPRYTVDYLQSHFYKIGKATRYGDRIFLLDENGNAIHSAVYLADDIVFTKNGNNYAQPWMLMHLKDLVAEYSLDGPVDIAVYRDKNL